MANLVLTNCDFLVPVDRVCWGNKNIDLELCETCPVYAEKKKSRFLFKKGRVFGTKNVSVRHKVSRAVKDGKQKVLQFSVIEKEVKK